MIVAQPVAPIVHAVKTVYPRSPIDVTRVCIVGRTALVRLRVRGRESYVALEHPGRKWKPVWVDGATLRSVPSARRAKVAAEAKSLRTRCLAP